MKKIILRTLLVIILAALSYGIYYAWQAVPIMTGYSAKNMCSCVMVAGRKPDDVVKEELSFSPANLATTTADFSDSSATSALFGLARRKAIFRKGLGCSLLVEIDEDEFRKFRPILPVKPRVNQDSLLWPDGNLQAEAPHPDADIAKLNQAIEEAFRETGPKKTRRTRAVLIVHDGKIIAERYADGFDQQSLLTGWSMTKSVTNALIGILVKGGELKLDQPAPVRGWEADDHKNITINDLMHASSGLEWVEDYGSPSGATNMLFKSKDMGISAATAKVSNKPGEVFYYSSGTTNILSRIIREKVGDERYYKFPYEELLFKIGMHNTILETDAGGTIVGSSYSFGPARDWARFGLLYLKDGVWNGERILPEGWVKYTTTPAKGAKKGQYGAQWWLNAGAPDNPSDRMYPDAPTDLFWADGYEGQNVFVIPSKKLVIVKLSLSHNGEYMDDNAFLKNVVAALD
jgi:CubicO group peptidase (beta-lactamase class C family)